MKYVVIGAGGTGGAIGGFMSKAGKDVTLIARGEHLKQMQNYKVQFLLCSLKVGDFQATLKHLKSMMLLLDRQLQ